MSLLSKFGIKKPENNRAMPIVKRIPPHISTCRLCEGRGTIVGKTCWQCHGSGRVIVTSKVETIVTAYNPES